MAKKNPVKVTDVTVRDGQQSIFATRMQTGDMENIAAEMNKAGFYSVEVWGGATFDAAIRFLNEDPWDRPRILKKLIPDIPLQMLVRGQSLVGYRHYADDVVNAFMQHAADAGIDIFRVFDSLNDERNLETCLAAIKKSGKHAQLAICYSLTGRKMGGQIYNLDYFLKKAEIFQDMGADSICIKDMAGLLSPDDAYTLVKALKRLLKVPLQLHTHYTSGMASMTCLRAIQAGVDIIDTALAPFALRSSHPAIEPIIVALQGTARDTGLDLSHMLMLGEYFESIAPKYSEYLNQTRLSVIDTSVLAHQIPGGMISNLVTQLRQANALDKLNQVYKEVPKVRKELGYPPLVTPTSQIVGVQAVQNVIVGRYKLIPTQVTDYCRGLYGRPPASIDPDVLKKVLRYVKKDKPVIDCRPADLLEPALDSVRESIKDITGDIGDILTVTLYPETGLSFVKKKYGRKDSSPK
ncbi:pyruvate carboxylase subunit B [Chloroflexota bacterium]